MTVLVDTNVIVAFHNPRDAAHARALELLDAVRRGRFGLAVTTDFVFDEAVTLALMRTGSHRFALRVGEFLLPPEGPRLFQLEPVDDRAFAEAWQLFRTYRERRLSFTDWTSVAMVRGRGWDGIASFDAGFDGLVARFDTP
ncbi:MAG: PIN domain-containing protein [Candidatus Thermoplasmatota archaeon]